MCNPSLSPGLGFYFPGVRIKIETKKSIYPGSELELTNGRNRFLVCYLNHSATMPYLLYFGGLLKTGNGGIPLR